MKTFLEALEGHTVMQHLKINGDYEDLSPEVAKQLEAREYDGIFVFFSLCLE